MNRRFAILLVLGVVAAACGGNTNSDGPSGVDRVPTTTTAPAPPVELGNPNVGSPSIVEPCEPPEDLEAFCGPFTHVQGSLRVVWDRWFWGQGMFSRGTVEVFDGDELVVSGPFFGGDTVMLQQANGDFTFVDAAGDVITVVTQQELAPVILAALEGAGIGGAQS